MATVAVFSAFVYLDVAGGRPVHLAESDSFGYAWQMRVLGAAPIANVGNRPGVAGVGSILIGLKPLPPRIGPLVLGLALAAALALACAAAARLAFRLPAWAAVTIAAFTVFWTGLARLSIGYLANLASLVAFLAFIALLVLPDRGRLPWAAAVCMLAAGIIHPGLLAAYAAILGMWLVVSLPRMLSDRKQGRALVKSEPVVAIAILVAAAVAVAFLMFIVMGLRVSEVADFQSIKFAAWLSAIADRLLGPLPVALSLVGVSIVWLADRGRPSRTLTRLGLAWLIVALAGAAITLVVPTFPGHRSLLMALPLAVVPGFAIAGVLALAGRVTQPLVKGSAVTLTLAASIALLVAVARPGVAIYRAARSGPPPAAVPSSQVTAYVVATRPDVPVVVVMDPPRDAGAQTWKIRLNAIRAFAPRDSIANIVLYLGPPPQALAGHPTQMDATFPNFNQVSQRLWRDYGSQFADPRSIILVPRAFVTPEDWDRATAAGAKLALPDLAVARGPIPESISVEPLPSASAARAWVAVILCFLVLAAVGGGYSAATFGSRGAKAADVFAFAPAMGMVALSLGGLAIAIAGGDPAGPVGVAAAVLVGASGYLWAGYSARSTRRGRGLDVQRSD